MKKYRENSWVDSRLIVKSSKIKGRGIFTTRPIKEGEVVIAWGGTVFTKEDIKNGKARVGSWAAIGEDIYIGGLDEEGESIDQFLNHSCDPNLWMKDEVTLEARRDIKADEELTVDYSSQEGNEDWIIIEECSCGSKLCRHKISGKDWRLKELQQRYKDHFSPFINRRIQKLNSI